MFKELSEATVPYVNNEVDIYEQITEIYKIMVENKCGTSVSKDSTDMEMHKLVWLNRKLKILQKHVN